MADTVTIIIDDQEYAVPAGANLVDAAKHIGNDIPVFCYHPKMAPVGMCRMCLVEMGSIQKDRATGEVMVDEAGNPQIRWFPKLQTACTTTVSDGLVIRTNTEQVDQARENVVEFLLTSHPLDCPICDKGGECPLQNLTMEHGPGRSRMHYGDKMHLDKHVPLGDLIFLDEERCIQCARCIRFQEEIAGDDVLAFHERGRRLQIITNSDPGFDSYFSGNTTDICPVGALTTADFRFGARPWELTEVPSIDPWDAAGSNISLSTRLDREHGGRAIIKRVMPRQNEQVNEIWISDKARFGHHFSMSADRLTNPMVGQQRATWHEAVQASVDALNAAGGNVAAIAGSGLSNEDLYALRQLVQGAGSEKLGAWPPTHAGADLVAQVGVGKGTNLGKLGKGDAVLIIATDLEEEVPIWRLRLKQARDRGAYVVVANARSTRMDDFASAVIHYNTGLAAYAMTNIKNDYAEIAQQLADATNLVIVAGAEGLTLEGSRALMQAAANFLIDSGHVGKPNNGLLSPFPGPNGMGQYYMGFTPETTQAIVANPPKVLVIAQADVLLDDPSAASWLDQVDTVINLTLFQDELGDHADIVLPIQSFAERDGSYTNGERRVQRFYTAHGPVGEALPAWQAISRIGELAGQGRAKLSAAATMMDIIKDIPAFEGCRYQDLARTEVQFPVIGDDVYYGGTAYRNRGGLGVQIATAADNGESIQSTKVSVPEALSAGRGKLLIMPVVRLYNRERAFRPSDVVHVRVPAPHAGLNPEDAKRLKVDSGDTVEIEVDNGPAVQVEVIVLEGVPAGTVTLPRHLTTTAMPLVPVAGKVSKVTVTEHSKVGS
ncbi:MAG: NADH dehydrogenase (quinone) subunit G [Anaerolineaceae bacterium]|nr:NADH dehydrogenase (quinone) subunit G [Anaerolineaceae bacterium]